MLSGFSAGIAVVKTIMSRWSLSKYNDAPYFEQRHWGVFREQVLEKVVKTWRKTSLKLWDLDSQHSADTGSWEDYTDKLDGWVPSRALQNPRVI